MNLLLTLLIVAADPAAPIEARYPGGSEVYRCDFGEAADQDFDDWPDDWSRRRGRGFPEYLAIKIADEGPAGGQRSLRIELDGGGAAVYAPALGASCLYNYVLEGLVKTEGLVNDRAFLSLGFLDPTARQPESYVSEKVRDSQGWRKIRLGPIAPAAEGTRQALIGLHVEPEGEADLKGAVLFGDLWLARLPRILLWTENRHHLFFDPGQVVVHCRASGYTDDQTAVAFRLHDARGNELARAEERLVKTIDPHAPVAGSRDSAGRPVLVGSADWKPPIAEPGYYRVLVTLPGEGGLVHERELALAVVQPQAVTPGGEFGWTLPQGERPLGLTDLGQVLAQAGVSWIKYPMWYWAQTDPAGVEELVRFCERMTAQGIQLVGLLSDPPQELRKQFPESGPISAATVLSADPKVWYPSLEPVLMRASAQVEWWQLGGDNDFGFVDYPNLESKISQIKAELDRVGHDLRVGMAWRWLNRLPQASQGKPPWQFLALSADPPLTHQELPAYLDDTKDAGIRRWLVLSPLGRQGYSSQTRITDLVRRMMAAKTHGAEAAFVPEPFNTDHGLMNDDGAVGELFLPWRTTALALGGTTFLGSIQMPEGSQNLIFARDKQAVMAVWADRPQKEVIYLGDRVELLDLWGRRTAPRQEGSRQVIEVDTLPTFVLGVDRAIASWEQEFAIANPRLPSIFGRGQKNAFHFKNSLNQGISGTVELVGPETWKINPRQTRFRLSENQSLEQPFEITLPFDATSGIHGIRADLEIQAERTYRFSVYRRLDIGLGDVYVELFTHLNSQGELEVEQRFVNESQTQVSFRCYLFVPNRRREKTEIINLGAGSDVQTYRLPNGEELAGKYLWLRAEEINGPRVLNYRFQARE